MPLHRLFFGPLLELNPFSADFWKNLPAIMTAAKDNPWGVAALAMLLLSLIALAFAQRLPPRFRYLTFVTLGVMLLALIGAIYAGSTQMSPKELTVSGKVSNAKDGSPVARAKVSLATEGLPRTAITNSDGVWVVDHFQIPSGVHVVKVSVVADDFLPYDGDLAVADVAQPPPITLRARNPSTPLPLPRMPAPAQPSAMITGRIFTEEHTGVDNAEVLFESGGATPQSQTVHSSENGSFRITKVRLRDEDDPKLTISKDGFRVATIRLTAESAKHQVSVKLRRQN